MWANPISRNPLVNRNVTKERINLSIDKNLYEQFRVVAQKDMRKYSNIVESGIRRYINIRGLITINFVRYNIISK